MTDKLEMPSQLSNEATPLSSKMNWPLLSGRKTNVELKTDDPTPFSSKMNWPLIGGRGEGNVELMTGNPTIFSSKMGWPLLSDKPTMFDTQLNTTQGGGSSSTGDGGFSKFLRGIMTGEVQK
ncbi:hypothetical protein [Rhodovulum strictum]|uniref:Uncharacterized protein n=1 Tax=Rhodovulum strictum TaxID=58314 RepID=A0A844BH80_9RHOB|nr:hypothetical protein [Rhodovulum strictum]MRH20815.1 hypothetical protein [Rhodovulum strictum]